VVTETDLDLSDGRTLHVYDTGTGDLPVFWHHGTPQTGAPPEPLFAAADRLGIRWVSHDRPGYGGSSAQPGRDVAAVATDVAAVADALGVERFAVLGASGGGPHSLACAALLPDRVLGVVSVAGLAPLRADGLDWFAGMADFGAAELRAATGGRAALAAYFDSLTGFDPELFTPADHATLAGEWSWLGVNAARASAGDPAGMLDDDLAYVMPWGFDPTRIEAPILLLHGVEDRCVPSTHGEWLARHCPSSEFRPTLGDGHISVLTHAEKALDWLAEHARRD
jgi:pimeloyl-ACP methyl ester carboxylesterase